MSNKKSSTNSKKTSLNSTKSKRNTTKKQQSSKFAVQGAKQAIDRMKYEIANEFGVNLGPDSSSRANGLVGGEITKRLIKMGESNLGGKKYKSNSKKSR